MDRTRRHESDRVLVAGAVEDLAEIHRLLVDLPDTAYGQVFIEVALAEQVRILPAPPRVSVTWLVRSERSSVVPSLCFADHGEALAAAVLAWTGEWCLVGSEPCTVVWIGCSDSPWIEQTRAAVQSGLDAAGQQVQVETGG